MKFENDFYVTGAKVGKPAPKFEMDAVLPTGDFLDRFGKVNLDDLLNEGKWVVLYFYPLDFTFVCPTEIKRFNALTEKFAEMNAELIACSTDSVFSHLAWQERSDLERLKHIHASDNNHVVSEAYGVLDDEKGVAWRGTFFIAPDGTLKAAHVNHGEGGRNVDEVLRTLQVFQKEVEGEMVPCGWNPGDDLL
ncbi:MAG: Alkyl hydroperoxide reductase subunit C [Candidatus Izimaplasma bacterium HR2]|nr:MAG: Alkyl hydroperoxide reductase subunit C [Candidatus Izimaplasma bacterium HR2]